MTKEEFKDQFVSSFPKVKSKVTFLMNFLDLQEEDYTEFMEQLRKMFPNYMLMNQFNMEFKLFNRFIKTFGLETLKIRYWRLPPLNEYFALFHSGFVYWMPIEDVAVNEPMRRSKTHRTLRISRHSSSSACLSNYLCIGGNMENLIYNSNNDTDTDTSAFSFVFNFNPVLEKMQHFKERIDFSIPVSKRILLNYNVLIVSLKEPMIDEKVQYAVRLWKIGFRAIISHDEINFPEKIYKKAAESMILYIIVLKPHYKNDKIHLRIVQQEKDYELEFDKFEEIIAKHLTQLDKTFLVNYRFD